jgi:putative spermidine/putrescine transport system permease protein
LAFIYIPLIVLGIYAFNSSKILEWPPPGFTFEWFPKAIESTARDAFWTSIKVGLAATAIALVLGTLASLAVARHRFFGRETISFLVVLPIALPGIVTGVALNNTFTQVLGIDLSLFTVIVAHATFCIVVVYNNSIARLRRMSSSFEEASADLGASTWQTFRYVTLPNMRSALGAGGLLAFGLSFDEIIVTTFTIGAGEETLPYWIFSNLFRAQERPIVNAVAVIVVLISIVPVYLAYRLTGEEDGVTTARGGRGRIEGGGVETKATAVP